MVYSELVLSLENVSKVYGSGELAVTTLSNVNLQVYIGEIVAVMGPSGSGKTTLLTIAGAILRPTTGRVLICGIDVTRKNEAQLAHVRREKIGFIYQSFNLLEALSAIENVILVINKRSLERGLTPEQHARELLEMLGIGHRIHSLPRKMSDGEKQRVAIARALAKDTQLILADEPTGNLDSKRGQKVMELLRQKSQELHKAVVVVSHDDRIREFADKVVWLEDGRLTKDQRSTTAASKL